MPFRIEFDRGSRMSVPLSPPAVKDAGRRELPAYLSNGVVGLRVRDNPLTAGMALLSGYSGLHPERKIEAAAVTPYPLAADVALNGVWLSDVPHLAGSPEQSYDFANGELTSKLRFSVQEVRAEIRILTFCCRHQPTLVAQEIEIRVNVPCDILLRSIVDARQVGGRLLAGTRDLPAGEKTDIDGSLLWESPGALSQCGIATATQVLGADANAAPASDANHQGPLTREYGFRARASKTYRLRQIASLVPSVMHSQPNRQAERLVALGSHQGFDALRKANRAEWVELWKGRVLLHGAGRKWQQLADAAFFYMNSSVHVGSPASTSIFGLATWHDYHYYYGHVMWDIETFCVPTITLTQPEAAEALLDYRFRFLSSARTNAQGFGRKGLQFAWESAPTTGHEASPSPGTAAWHEDHASLDVALAFAQFAHLTGDKNFLADRAWPVLSGVADWIVSRSHKSRRGYEIRRSMGIAERKKESDNEAFTMLSARAVLNSALEAARLLGRTPGVEWQNIASRLVLPIRDGVLVSHDAFRANEEKAATPGPLMGVYPLAELDEATARATLDYYLPLAKDYIGSPMLSALYGVWASRRGNRTMALKMLEEGYARFLSGRFLQTLEYRVDRFPEQPMAGPFFANMGGFLMSLMLGFPMLEIGSGEPQSWIKHRVVLPKGWKEIEIERIWLKGRPARLRAKHGHPALISFN